MILDQYSFISNNSNDTLTFLMQSWVILKRSGVARRSPQPAEVIVDLGAKPLAAGEWGSGGKFPQRFVFYN